MGDEGIGSHVAQFISKNGLPEGIKCLDGGTGGFHLLGNMQNAFKIYLIDATIDNQKPGTITRLTPRFSTDYPRTLTAHDIGLKDLIDSFHLLGKVPEVILYAVSIISPNQVSLELSPELKEIIPQIASQILLETSKDIKLAS